MKRDKIKTMVRSILPSTRRGVARDKALLKRELRRGVRLELRTEDFEESPADFQRDVSMSGLVWGRRGGDKLNHFIRWCEALTKGMSTEDALSFVKSILPDSVIGQHAYRHWEQHRKPKSHAVFESYRGRGKREEQSYVDSTTFRLRRAMADDPTLLGRLNAAIKHEKPLDQPRRLLLGIHDVADFVRTIVELPYDDERRVTRILIEAIEGGREAALSVYADMVASAASCVLLRHATDGYCAPHPPSAPSPRCGGEKASESSFR